MPPAETLAASRIAVLPAAVADAIAAGEVVDRPAAVVKELVENAIDAGARRIVVRVQDAGRGLVEVVDDGSGIFPEDLLVAFQRHATSKISRLEDMRAVRTLGFRGEALASIAAVAEMEAVSRAAGRETGHRVLLQAGAVLESGVAGSPPGTRVTVKRLFFNTPARLRFLKQPATENGVIVRLVSELALAWPDRSLRLELDQRRVIDTDGSGDVRATLAALYDAETAAAMLSLDDAVVEGLIAPPSIHRATRDHTVILVNRRRIHHRNLAFAVEQAYRGLRDPDRFPIAVLNLRIEASDVDVNVHPTKREVRFRNERALFAAIERACYRALRRSPVYELRAAEAGLDIREAPVLTSYYATAESGVESIRGDAPPAGPSSGESVNPTFQPGSAAGASRLPPLTYVGQLLDSYLVAESRDAVVLIDQHAAHERVLFDRILERLDQRSPAGQLLLLPQVIELGPAQVAALQSDQEWIERLGFQAEPFGPQTVRLRAAPAELPDRAVADVFARLLDDLAQERTPDARRRDTAALLACHGAVRFGDRLTAESASGLLAALSVTSEPISCPHGRPTTLVLPDHQLRRLFRRP
jgi:DNA mismatch repair protein MutL